MRERHPYALWQRVGSLGMRTLGSGPWLPPLQQSPCFCPDVNESAWRPAAGSGGPRKQPGGRATDLEGLTQRPAREAHGSPKQPAALPSKPLLSAPVRNGERLTSLILDAQHPLGDLERSRLRKVQTFPRLLPDGPEAVCLTLTPTKNQLPTSEVFPPDPRKAFLDGKNGLSSYKSQPKSRLWLERESELQQGGPGDASQSGDKVSGALGQSPVEESAPPCSEEPGDAGREPRISRADERTPDRAGESARTAAEQVGDSGSHPAWPGGALHVHARSCLWSHSVLIYLEEGSLSLHSCSVFYKF